MIYTNKTMINSLELPEMSRFADLVRETRLSAGLVYWLSCGNYNGKYNTFFIKKGNGDKREINAPIFSLKILQRWVLEEILYKIKPSKYSYGFTKNKLKGSPILECSKKHINNRFVLKLDLKSFYPSISRKQIFSQFIKIGYGNDIANLLTNICVKGDCLPQGAVTSPFLANLICSKMDARISGYCNKRNIVYTRYADDLTFSCNDKTLLRNTFGMIKKIVEDEGFSLNERKTTLMTPKNCKRLLGVNLNANQPKVPKELKRKIRSMIHYTVVSGDYNKIKIIRGYISYIDSIEKGYKEKCKKYILKIANSPVCMFKEVVEAFNSNKIFNDLPDMVEKRPSDFVSVSEENTFSTDIINDRIAFLKERNMEEIVEGIK